MPTKTIDTDQIKHGIDLREFAGRYTTLHRESSHEMAGPCPKCGGNDRFHVTPDSWFCRRCYPLGNGKPHDVFAFVMWLNGCGFKDAVALLTNAPLPIPASGKVSAPKRQATQQHQPAQPIDWQRKAAALVEHGHRRLFDDADTESGAGRHFLENVRGLEPHIWLAFKLGFLPNAPLPGTWDDEAKKRTHPGAPAIIIPWYKNAKVLAVRYRFLETHTYLDAQGKERTENKSSLYGSDFKSALFGRQALEGNIPELSTVLLVEGEINAMSIWQTSRYTHLDVFSLGGQDSRLTESIIEYIKRYACIMCWLDEDDRAVKVADVLPNDAYPIKSVDKQDANDALKAGKLGGILALHRLEATKGDKYKQERLLWDLYDAARLWNGVDKDTKRVIRHIAKTLGKTVQLTEVSPGTWRAL